MPDADELLGLCKKAFDNDRAVSIRLTFDARSISNLAAQMDCSARDLLFALFLGADDVLVKEAGR